jgi:chemotaxis response regulator CheB
LQAFKTFFANMPTDSGMAFVLVQHLDPNHKSMLVDLLGAQTAMPVVIAGLRGFYHEIAGVGLVFPSAARPIAVE